MEEGNIKQASPPPGPPPPPEPALVKPDSVSENDVAALVGILIKTVQLDKRLAEAREKLAEINKEIAADSLLRAKAINALNLFGFDSTQQKVWTAVREVIGHDAYQRGLDIGQGRVAERIASLAPKPSPLTLELRESAATHLSNQLAKSENTAPPKIGDAILAFMRARGKAGVKASEVRDHLKSDYGIDTHEKTPGMTLYRLSKDGLVRRENRIWFATEATEGDGNHEKTATDR